MKSVFQQVKPVKVVKDLTSKKQSQNRSTLNSGRSSTTNNKRHSYELSYQTQAQIVRNFNKQSLLSLNRNLHQNVSSGVSHKVIVHEDKQQRSKCKNVKSYQQTIVRNKGQAKLWDKINTKTSSVDSSRLQDRLHSHRASVVINPPVNLQKFNSDQKENIGSNIQQLVSNRDSKRFSQKGINKKPVNQENKPSLNKLNFILEKEVKQKLNQGKKKLILVNECLQSPHLQYRTQKNQKQKIHGNQKGAQLQTCSTFTSIKDSRKSIGSARGRSRSIEKKKENFIYLKTNDRTNNSNITHMQKPRYQIIRQQQSNRTVQIPTARDKDKNYLKLKSSTANNENKISVKEDQKIYSIKTLLKELIKSEDNTKQRKIKNIIQCLTTADNDIHGKEMDHLSGEFIYQKLSVHEPQQTLLEECEANKKICIQKFMHKINGFDYQQQNQERIKNENDTHSDSIKQAKQINTHDDENTSLQQVLTTQSESHLIKQYEIKIVSLYEELIEQKQKRYRLQDMIENYIEKKEKSTRNNYSTH